MPYCRRPLALLCCVLYRTYQGPRRCSSLSEYMMHGATGMQDSNGAIRAPQGLKVLESDAAKEQKLAAMVCSLTAKDECLMCGS